MRYPVIFFALIGLFVCAATAAAAQDASRGTVTGRVVDHHGKAIAGARVTASGAADAQATTDAKGSFRLELAPGDYQLQFEAEGHATAALREPITVRAGKETKIKRRVELPEADETSTVRGSVFSAEGLAVVDARVSIDRVADVAGSSVEAFHRETESDSMGLFTFRLPKGGGRYRLTAARDGYGSASVTIELSGGELLNAPPLTLGRKP